MRSKSPCCFLGKPVIVTMLLVFMSVLGSGCIDLNTDDGDERILIVVSILPQKEFAGQVGGEHVKVTVMVGEGQDPHGYEPRPSQLKDVAGADLYFKVGSGMEFENVWMDTLIEQNDEMEIVDGSANITLIHLGEGDHEHQGDDPHIWNSPMNARIMVENLRDALVRIDPEHADDYANNTRMYLAELDAIDVGLKDGLEPHKGAKFLVYHPSFGYLAHAYDLVQIAIEDEGKEPTPAGVQAIIDQAKEENITTVFVSPQFDESNAEAIAGEIGGTVVRIDPLGEKYIENMNKIRDELVAGFEQGSE